MIFKFYWLQISTVLITELSNTVFHPFWTDSLHRPNIENVMRVRENKWLGQNHEGEQGSCCDIISSFMTHDNKTAAFKNRICTQT